MKGDKKRFNKMKKQLDENCGPRCTWDMLPAEKETECRRLLGVSTPQEVRSQAGFKGTWIPSVQPLVDTIIKKMTASRLYGPTMKKIQLKVGGGTALATTRSVSKKRKAETSLEEINSEDDDENMLLMLRELMKGQRDMNNRVNRLEAGVTDLPKDDEDDSGEDDDEDEEEDEDEQPVTKTDKADKLETMLAAWKNAGGVGVPNKETKRAAAANSEPARPKGAATASDAFLRLMDSPAV